MPDAAEALVTIGDLIADPSLSIVSAVLPAGASERPVSWVHATEQLDPRPHLRRHELVCTLGSALVRPRSADTFVSALAEAGVAGVALGLGEVHLGPPSELVDACERAGLPLLLLPHGVPFLSVNDTVLRRRSELESEARKRETALLSRLLTLARRGAGEAALLTEAAEALGGGIRRVGTGALEWADGAGGPSGEFMEQLQSLLEFSGLEQARESSEQQLRLGQLLDLVAAGLAHPAAILPEIDAHGLARERLRVSSWPAGSEGAIGQHWADGLVGVTAREVILISGPDTEESLRSLGLVCGYSSLVGFGELRRALSESRSALRLARSRGGVAGPDQLVSLDALLEQQPAELLDPFVEQLIAPIVRADELARGDLMETLAVFIASDRQLQATAERLYVHVNTVRHRLHRIHELSGRDPLSLDGLVDLRIALWAVERRETIGYRLIRPLH